MLPPALDELYHEYSSIDMSERGDRRPMLAGVVAGLGLTAYGVYRCDDQVGRVMDITLWIQFVELTPTHLFTQNACHLSRIQGVQSAESY